MAARYMVIISTLDSGWLEGKVNLSEWQVPYLGGVISQAFSPLEDPDEGVRTTNRCAVMHHSEAKGDKIVILN